MAKKEITPYPLPPDPSEYEHMTMKERMIAGYPYRPGDKELFEDREKSRELTYQFNSTAPKDRETRRKILRDLLHPDSKVPAILPPFRVDYGYNIIAGENVFLNFDCIILDCGLVKLGDNFMAAPGVHIYSATHPLDPKHRQDDDNYYEMTKPVVIGKNCWVGGKAVILPGVTIGDNVVVGAGSVVTKDIPNNVVVGGNPAKIIRYLEGADIS